MKMLDEFADVCSHVWHHEVPQVQRQESERMFVAGYSAAFMRVCEASKLPSTQEELAELSRIAEEIRDYWKLLGTIPGPRGQERQ